MNRPEVMRVSFEQWHWNAISGQQTYIPISGPACTITWGGRPIACGGLNIVWTGLATAWCAVAPGLSLSEKYSAYMGLFVAFVKTVATYRLRRVHAFVRADMVRWMRFAERFGFVLENFCDKCGPNGERMAFMAYLEEKE